MKILLINNAHYRRGGADTVYLNTAEILKSAGHNVVFFSFNTSQTSPNGRNEYFAKPKKKTRPISSLMSYFYNNGAAQSLERLIIAEKPDIAHVHLIWGGMTPSICDVLHKYHIPIVHTAHDYRMVCPAYTFKKPSGKICEECQGHRFYKCAQHRCSKGSLLQSIVMSAEAYYRDRYHNPAEIFDGIIYVSHFSQHKHIQYNVRLLSVPSTVLYNCACVVSNTNRTKGNYCLYYGRLSQEKGLPTLIKAFSISPELKLKVVGTGPMEAYLKALCEKKCYDNIEILGYHSGETLYELVQNAKFVCVPSEWYENNPMTIVESYSLGTPVIGANIGGIPEIVLNEQTGYLFESGNIQSLNLAINKALSITEQEYSVMCNRALEFANKNFNSQHYLDSLLNFYKNVIDDYRKNADICK